MFLRSSQRLLNGAGELTVNASNVFRERHGPAVRSMSMGRTLIVLWVSEEISTSILARHYTRVGGESFRTCIGAAFPCL